MATESSGGHPKAAQQAPDPINRPLETSTISLDEAQELVHIGTWQWDVATGDISWSDELYRIYGLKPGKKAIGFEEFIQLIHPEDRERVSGLIGEAYQSKRSFEFEHRIMLPNKKIRILEGKGKVVMDNAGNVVRMFGTSQDITERKKADQALYRSNERFHAVSAATNDVVYDIDLQDGSIWFNDVLCNEYKYPEQDSVYPRGWRVDHIHPGDRQRIKRSIAALLRSQDKTWAEEYRFQKHDGTYTDVRDRALVLRDSSGKPTRIIGSMLDITQQKDLERAKDRFISLVSHQLRTPLTSMRLLTEMLAIGYTEQLTEAQQDYIQKIESSTERMIKLVNEILDVSNIESGRLHTHLASEDIRTLITGQIEEIAPLTAERDTHIVYNPAEEPQTLTIDSVLFSQIVHNLLTNAIRYTLEKGTTVHVSFEKADEKYVLAVSDQGIGIPEESWPHIFTSFYRANNAIKTQGDGSGLGLYLTKLILDMTGGDIWFESEQGKGSTFYVSLPSDGMHHVQEGASLA